MNEDSDRLRLIRETVEQRGIDDPRILEAMRSVPRHLFVPESHRDLAYADSPVSLGHGQTVSQPYVVAVMTQALQLQRFHAPRVLEIGTGSGYQTAILEEMGAKVFSIEIVEELANQARTLLRDLGYDLAELRVGDGYEGWLEESPFDGIILTAAPSMIPTPLINQLAVGGILVAPVGTDSQELFVLERREEDVVEKSLGSVRFVPMTGKARP